jgi:hypothetical protein
VAGFLRESRRLAGIPNTNLLSIIETAKKQGLTISTRKMQLENKNGPSRVFL